MKCEKCGHKNDSDALFCSECGEVLNKDDRENKIKKARKLVFVIFNFLIACLGVALPFSDLISSGYSGSTNILNIFHLVPYNMPSTYGYSLINFVNIAGGILTIINMLLGLVIVLFSIFYLILDNHEKLLNILDSIYFGIILLLYIVFGFTGTYTGLTITLFVFKIICLFVIDECCNKRKITFRILDYVGISLLFIGFFCYLNTYIPYSYRGGYDGLMSILYFGYYYNEIGFLYSSIPLILSCLLIISSLAFIFMLKKKIIGSILGAISVLPMISLLILFNYFYLKEGLINNIGNYYIIPAIFVLLGSIFIFSTGYIETKKKKEEKEITEVNVKEENN